MSDERRILSYLNGNRRFNYRVAGIAVRNEHVLVCREDEDDYVMLPGGRVEMGEPSDVALHREIEEELQCTGEVGRLMFTSENFFERVGEKFHEIGLYYLMELPTDFPFMTEKSSLVTFDEGHELTFSWVPVDAVALEAINLMPQWLHAKLATLPDAPIHVVADER